MPNRRDFIKGVAGATAGLWVANGVFTGNALAQNQGQGRAAKAARARRRSPLARWCGAKCASETSASK